MVDLLRPNTFYSVLQPLFYFSKLFGLAPISLRSTYYKRSKISTVWSIIVLTAYVVAFAFLNKRQTDEAGYITQLTIDLSFYCNNVDVWVEICLNLFFADGIASFVRDIDKFDKKLQVAFKSDIVQTYRRSVIRIYITIALIAVFMTNYLVGILLIQSYNSFLTSFGGILIEIGAPLINTIAIFQFSAVVLSLKTRFEVLNIIIENISKSVYFQTDMIFTLPTSTVHHKIFVVLEDVRHKHNELCRICRNINTCYSFQILIIILQNFITIILELYFGGKGLFQNYEGFMIYFCCSKLFLATAQIVILVLACASTATEARKTGDLIHTALSSQEPCREPLYLQTTFFSMQLMHTNIEFTACGVFTIDASLLLSILGAITTYLVIVVQFEISYPSP